MQNNNSISCDHEPIHLINELQDFGFIIILSLEDDSIIACGDNSIEYLGISPDELLLKKTTEIFDNYNSIKLKIEEVLISKNQQDYIIHFQYREKLLFATFRKSENL